MKKLTVAILGASNNPERFSNKAFLLLRQLGYEVFLINPKAQEIQGLPVYTELKFIKVPIDTLTVYVNAEISEKLLPQIINLKPRRVIFNPGTENFAIEKQLVEAGIQVVTNCTLIMLNSGNF